MISVGGMVVQSVVNGFGFLYVAGFTATNKLYGLLELAATSLGYGVATYVGQNLGARKFKRIKQGVKTTGWIGIAIAIFLMAFLIPFGRYFLNLFVSGNPQDTARVLNIAYSYLFVMCCLLWVLYILHVYRSALQGMGNTFFPMLSGVAELVLRIGAALILPRYLGANGIYFAEGSAWIGAVLILLFAYAHKIKSFPDEPAVSSMES